MSSMCSVPTEIRIRSYLVIRLALTGPPFTHLFFLLPQERVCAYVFCNTTWASSTYLSHTRADTLLLGQLLVGGGPRVDGERLGVADVGEVGDELAAVDDLAAGGAAALDAEAEHAAAAAREVLPGQRVGRVAGQARVRHPADVGALLQVLGEALGVVGVALGAQAERLAAQQELLGGEGVEAGAQVAEELDAHADDEGDGAERLPELEPVVAVRRLHHLREPVGVLAPVELAAVHHHAADGRPVPADPLGGRVHDDVGAVVDRPAAVAAGSERVVDLFLSKNKAG